MNQRKTKLKTRALAALVLAPFLTSAARAELDVTVFGVTATNTLVRFEHSLPGTLTSSVTISGLQSGETLVGMDFRPANNTLYGVGSTSRLYTINTTTGVATAVGSAFATTLSGTNFGVDFNPAADRLRIVSDADQSLRINPDTGAVAAVDTTLAYDATDAQTGVNPNVTGAAYTVNRAAAPTTTLLGIDSALGNMVRVGGPNSTPSPNAGQLFSLGSLGLGTTLTNVGFDVGAGKSSGSVLALAAVTLNGETSSKLYTIDTAGGRATLIGTVGGTAPIIDIAISPNDLVAPQVLVSGQQSIRLRDLRSSGYSATVSCSEACTATGTLTVSAKVVSKLHLSSATVGTAMVALGDSGNATLTVPLDATSAAAFNTRKGKRLSSADFVLSVSAVDAGGNTGTSAVAIHATR